MRRLLLFTVFFTLATVASVFGVSQGMLCALAGVAVLVCVAQFIWRTGALRIAAVCALGLCVGIAWCAGYTHVQMRGLDMEDGTKMSIRAESTAYAEAGTDSVRVRAKVSLDGRRGYKAIVYLPEDLADVKPGDILTGEASIYVSASSFDPDESLYDSSSGVRLRAYLRGEAEHTPAEKLTLRYLPAHVSYLLRQKIGELFLPEQSGFLSALLTGDRSGLSYEQKNDLQLAGVYHTVAVSGMHVSVLLGMIMLLCGERKRLAALIGLPVAVFFILMTGASASAVRAGCMQALLLLAPLFGRQNDPPTSVSAALLVLLLDNPWAIANVGLQLSFASVCGILVFSGRICSAVSHRVWYLRLTKNHKIASAVAHNFLTAFSCSIASMVFSTPLMAVHFGLLSIIAPVSNMLILWAVTICFAGGFIVLALSFISLPLAIVPARLLGFLAEYVLVGAKFLGRLPYAAVAVESPYMMAACLLVYAAALILAVRGSLRIRREILPLVGACIVCALLAFFDYRIPTYSFTALDVGNGQCLVFRCEDEVAVIDCGGHYDAEAGEIAARYLRARGFFSVKALVLTHFDEDHTNGTEQFLSRMQVEHLYLPSGEDESGRREEITQFAKAQGVQVHKVSCDTAVPMGVGTMQIFAPVSSKDSNDSGICVLASAEDYDILVTGDLSMRAEAKLFAAHELSHVDTLVAGHHGSKHSTGYGILQATSPQTVLISVGKNNTYGHPSDAALTRIVTAGAQIYRTDECGMIVIKG